MEELIVAFKEEILGGAEGLIEAITKFSTWFAAVDISEDKKISRGELYDHLISEILGNIGQDFENKFFLTNSIIPV